MHYKLRSYNYLYDATKHSCSNETLYAHNRCSSRTKQLSIVQHCDTRFSSSIHITPYNYRNKSGLHCLIISILQVKSSTVRNNHIADNYSISIAQTTEFILIDDYSFALVVILPLKFKVSKYITKINNTHIKLLGHCRTKAWYYLKTPWAMNNKISEAQDITEESFLEDEEFDYEDFPTGNPVYGDVFLDSSVNNISLELEELKVGTQGLKRIGNSATAKQEPNSLCNKKQSTAKVNIVQARKRERESDSSSEVQPQKIRRKFVEMLPMAAVVANEALVIDILPDMEGVTVFSETQAKTIKASFNRALFGAENFAQLGFENSGLDRGKFRIICKNAATRDWVIATIPHLEGLFPGAVLKAVQFGPPPTLIRATANVEYPALEPEDFFTVIAAQNPDINTSNWKLYNRNKPTGDRQLWVIGVDENSIPALKNVGCRPYCGMSRVRINLSN